MPAINIERSLTERVAEPILAWCNGQSLESRYSSSVPSVVGGAPARIAGAGVLRHQFNKEQRDDAVSMPRFPVIAVTADRIYVFDGPVARAGPLAVLERARCECLLGGRAMWRRLDIVDTGPPPQSYTVFFNLLLGGRGRLTEMLRTLDTQS
jgi:hypothetical protein